MKTLTATTAAILALALSGCAETAGQAEMSPTFGEAVRTNMTLQQSNAALDPALIRLSELFRAETDEVVTFAFDSASLDAAARRALDGQALWLLAHPQVRMAIVGHTDLVGSEQYNLGLGLRRAQAVLDYLVTRGVDAGRLVALESRGEEDPLVPTTEPERRNRRAVTMVDGYVGDRGFGLDGVYAARIYDTYQTGQAEVTQAVSTAAASE